MPESDQELLARVTELEQDNARLRRLLTQGGAPGELRHRLRSTIRLLCGVIRKSADGRRELADYVDQLLDRLEAVTRAQAAADQHGEVHLQALLADELLLYGMSEGDRLTLSGPEVRLKPHAGQVMALALHELAVNALEHGAIGAGDGRLDVAWRGAGPEGSLVLEWRESGVPCGPPSAGTGFGTEVLTRMLPYELGAEATVMPGSDGLRWVIHLPLPDRVGRIAEG